MVHFKVILLLATLALICPSRAQFPNFQNIAGGIFGKEQTQNTQSNSQESSAQQQSSSSSSSTKEKLGTNQGIGLGIPGFGDLKLSGNVGLEKETHNQNSQSSSSSSQSSKSDSSSSSSREFGQVGQWAQGLLG